jgi:hypothetical protein
MEPLEIVFISTVLVAVVCITFSTWRTLTDLRSTVFETEELSSSPQHGGAWHSFASHAAEHLPHGIRLSGKEGEVCVQLTLHEVMNRSEVCITSRQRAHR